MSPATQALLICVVFLCGLEDAVLALRGHCAYNRCFVLLRESEDFTGAQRRCSGTGGQLLTIRSEQVEETLTGPLSGHTGSYWLKLQGRKPEEATADLGNCSSVSMSRKGNIVVSGKQCSNRLDGVLCQYTFQDPCSRIKADGGAQVRYTTHMGFDASDSEAFPPGTIAAVDKVGGEYLDSKHVCASGGWTHAPWSCEVLKGGCEHSCNKTTGTCICPEGQTLHPNSITCAKDPSDGFPYAGECARGYKLAQDGKRCVDVNECEKGKDTCKAEGEECFNTEGGFECRCRDGFDLEDGACVDLAICQKCEHMLCVNPTGVYECACREGFRVSAKDPTKCKRHCTERDCEAVCTGNAGGQSPDMLQCECPEGYIRDMRNGAALCTDIDECETDMCGGHECENVFGGYRCVCYEGFRLHDSMCVRTEEETDGSGALPLQPTPATAHPAAVPSYIRTGSVLGITVFMALCAVLLCLVVRAMVKRCGRFELSSFRHPDIDVFYLQQVTTETYKRLSFDKQFKSDLQRL